MTADTPSSLVPTLRFPEFQDQPGWEHTALAAVFKTITNGQANAQDHQENGEFPLFDRSEVVKRSQTYLFDAEAVILPGEGMSFQPRYFKGKFNLHQRAYALMDPTVVPLFAYHALDRFKGVLADSAVQSTVRSLRMPIIEQFAIPCPKSEDEQEKIALCLTSLDDLIAAEGRKLEALRRHKQGLMQQLFPQPGESLPRLRFPEFEDAPEWEQRALGNLGVFIRGLTYTADDVAEAGLLVLRSSNIQGGRLVLDSDLVHVGKECPPDLLLREGDVAICMSNGSKALVGKSAEYRGGIEGDITVGAFCSIFRASNTFAKLAFATEAYSDYVALGIAGGNINNLKNSDLEAFEFYVPRNREEQQKIADCLGSLDDLIAAAGRRLEALRRHKQGLMQQLFPIPEEETR